MSSLTFEPPILFISDVHLGGFSVDENARIEFELIRLLDYCQHNQIRIVILGDLFDYWMEFPNWTPKIATTLLERFEEYNTKIGPTLYVTGNHDNWTREHFIERGFHLEHEHRTFSINGQNIMVLHGDGLANTDFNLERPAMHQLLRSHSFVHKFQSIFPPRLGISIMKYFSKITRIIDLESQKEEKLDRWSKQQLENTHLDIIICGHDHIPRRKQFPYGTFINLGTFYTHRTMAFYNNNTISLVCWEPDIQTFHKFDPEK